LRDRVAHIGLHALEAALASADVQTIPVTAEVQQSQSGARRRTSQP
jgi:hypothetical protein